MVEHSIDCPYCRDKAELHIDSSIIYRKNYGPIYLCINYPLCDSYVGCHPGSTTPLGRLANKELRHWKKQAHKYFDHIWRSKLIDKIFESSNNSKRGNAYKWLSHQLDLPREKTHIGMFDIPTCKKVVEICKPHYDE